MMRWQTKAALMRVFSRVPSGRDLHYIAQRRMSPSWPFGVRTWSCALESF
jgi:hypothetical protein